MLRSLANKNAIQLQLLLMLIAGEPPNTTTFFFSRLIRFSVKVIE